MKTLARRLLGHAGFQVTRTGRRHRFDAMADALAILRGGGYAPWVVIDAGANIGRWTVLARQFFPDATFHLIEPQPACGRALRRVASGGDRVHQIAVTRPGVARVRMAGGGPDGTCTGAAVVTAADRSDVVDVPATTLDEICPGVTAQDRPLLKLDLEGHEIEALRGAARLLNAVEVVIAEVQFFPINGNGLPTFPDVLGFLRDRGFELYDLAALAARPRDGRLKLGDAVFVSRRSPLVEDVGWQ